VPIFDGKKDSDIDLAMQTKFGRVASLMFVDTIVADVSGAPLQDDWTDEVVVEDDDCD
jgi:hypothetical protein